MKNLYKFFLFFGFLLSACSTSEKKEEKTLRISLQAEPISLDPRLGFDKPSQVVVKALFEGLMRIGLDGEVYPAVAETVSISDDGKVYIFKLRECYWTNGDPLLASDFVYTWRNILSNQCPCPLADLFYPIKNAREAKEQQVTLDQIGIEALDEKTLKVELEHPAPYFLHLLSNPIFSPVNQKIDLSNPDWSRGLENGFVCNGPFRLKQWKRDQWMVLEKNPTYHDAGALDLSFVHVNFIQDPYTALLMFEKGEIDWMGDPFCKIPLDALPELIEKKKLIFHPYAGIYWLECNTKQFPLNSSSIRKALGFAIDRQALVDHILLGQKVALGVVPEKMRLLHEDEFFVGNNEDKALTYFEEGLRDLGITRAQFPRLTLSYSSVPGYKLVAESLQQQWKSRLGIEVELACFEWGTYLSNFAKKDYQIASIGWVPFYYDPIYNLQVFRYRSNANNWSSWENVAFQDLLHHADHETCEEKRDAYLKEAEKILLDEMPVIPLTYQSYKYIKKDYVKDLLITDLGEVDFKWVTIANKK